MLDWMEQQQLDQERMEQENLEFYKRWAPKMSPQDREILRMGMVPWYKEEKDKRQTEMPLGYGSEVLFV